MVRTRFAPSPTGYLHIGVVRTALFNWLYARRHGGQFILRIDDTDQQRNVEESLAPILHGFRWLGIDWDEGPEVGGPHAPYFQSQRQQLGHYQTAVQKLLEKGVRDMVRISDARMSGTSYGACVLHVAPESFVGGPLALVRTGDLIELDVANRRLELKVSDAELARRRAAWKKPEPRYERGYGALYQRHITQADEGCDFDFLEGTAPTAEPEIH